MKSSFSMESKDPLLSQESKDYDLKNYDLKKTDLLVASQY